MSGSNFSFYAKNIDLGFYNNKVISHINLYSVDYKNISTNFANLDRVSVRSTVFRDKIEIEKINIFSKSNKIFGKGYLYGDISDFKKIKYDGSLKAELFLGGIFDDFKLKNQILGYSFFDLKIRGVGERYSLEGSLGFKDVVSSYFFASEGRAQFKVSNGDMTILSLAVKDEKGSLTIDHPFKIFNISNKKFYPIGVKANLINFSVDKALLFENTVLNGLEATLTGFLKCETDFHRINIFSEKLSSKKNKIFPKG